MGGIIQATHWVSGVLYPPSTIGHGGLPIGFVEPLSEGLDDVASQSLGRQGKPLLHKAQVAGHYVNDRSFSQPPPVLLHKPLYVVGFCAHPAKNPESRESPSEVVDFPRAQVGMAVQQQRYAKVDKAALLAVRY